MSFTDDFLKELEKKKKKIDNSIVVSPYASKAGKENDKAKQNARSSTGDSFTDEFLNELGSLAKKNGTTYEISTYDEDDDIGPTFDYDEGRSGGGGRGGKFGDPSKMSEKEKRINDLKIEIREIEDLLGYNDSFGERLLNFGGEDGWLTQLIQGIATGQNTDQQLKDLLKEYKAELASLENPEEAQDEKKDKWYEGWLKGGAFSDGYQVGDLAGTAIATVGDTALGVAQGFGNMYEGITDFILQGGSEAADWVGLDSVSDYLEKGANKQTINTLVNSIKGDYIRDNTIWGEKGQSIPQGVGNILGMIYGGKALGGAGLGTKGVSIGTSVGMGASSAGSGISDAKSEGIATHEYATQMVQELDIAFDDGRLTKEQYDAAIKKLDEQLNGQLDEALKGSTVTDTEAWSYGTMKGVIDAGTELLFGGLGKGVEAVGISRGIGGLDDMFAKKASEKLTKHITNKYAKRIVVNGTEYVIKAGGEGLEEVLATYGDAFAKKLSYMSDEELSELIDHEEALEAFISSFVSSGITQGGGLVSSIKGDTDYVTGYTDNEQAVIDKEIENRITEQEKNGKKLSNSEKKKITEAVKEDLDKGYISIDTIEEVLGGDSYKSYQDTVKNEDALKSEFEELEKVKTNDATLGQSSRYNELKSKLAELETTSERKFLESKYKNEAYEVARGSRLESSYFERARGGEAFTADLSKYDEKQRATIQSAIDAGFLNNRGRTHDFVNLIAKISADKGVTFDFLNNEKLKTSGFAVDGAIVNGYYDKKSGTVGINLNSDKALNTVVGHEITHVLEGTEIYNELQTALINYAKAKGDYQGRVDALSKLYDAKDIDSELTADLVGDYLFTDADFVNRLSTEHRNVFQKVFDEIKYLYKTATAGSKEARELEKVKRVFEEAYRTNVKGQADAQSDVKHSLSKITSEEDAEYLSEIEQGNTVYAGWLVDKAARQAGYKKRMFHETDAENIHVFDISRGTHGGTDSETPYGIFTKSTDKNIGLGNRQMALYVKADKTLYVKDRADVKNKIPSLVPYYDEIARIDQEYDKLCSKWEDAEFEALEEWVEANPDADMDVVYPTSHIIEKKPANIDSPKYLEAFEKHEQARKEWGERYDEIAIKCKEIITSYLRSNDYDSMYLEIDGGSRGRQTDSLIVLDANQVKSADPVTYDNKGNVIPLSERFNENSNDIRYSLSKDSDGKQLSEGDNERVFYTPRGIEVIQNPTSAEYRQMREEIYKEYPSLRGTGEAILRHTYDEEGNEYYWNAFDGMHRDVEPYINKKFNTRTSQQWEWWTREDKDDYPTNYSDVRYSLSDSQGRELTKEQSEFFKDSKIKDDNGNLKVMYHGTPNVGFTVFDKTKAKTMGTYGNGFYFTDSTSHAGTYGEAYEVYLNISNPLQRGTKNISKEQLRNFIEAVAENEDYGIENYGYGATIDSVTESVFGKDDISMLMDINISCIGNMVEAVELFNEVNGTDYNGIVVPTETVAFYPNQIKRVDNKNPTSDPDIRYSLSEDSNGRKLSKEQQAFFSDSQIRVSEVDGWKNTITANGALFPVYHGTNSDEFFEFDKDTIGSANDKGWYGKGFYFAFTEGEASFYGDRVLECYLNVKKPFFFSEEMQSYDGQERGDVNYDFAAFVLNLSDKFPEIAQKTFMEVSDKGEYKDKIKKPFSEFAQEIKAIYESDKFQVVEVEDRGEMTYQYRYSRDIDSLEAPERIKELIKEHYIDDAWVANWLKEKGTLTSEECDEILDLFERYGEDQFSDRWVIGKFDSRDFAEKNRLSAVISYMRNYKYGYFGQHMPEYFMEHYVGDSFGEELRKRGYDGVLQSRFGDEVVVFDSNQIKLTSNKKPTDSPDIRKSLSAQGENPQAYGSYNVYGKDIALEGAFAEDVAPVREDVAPVQEEVAPIADRVPPSVLFTKNSGEGGWGEGSVSASEAVIEATKYVNRDLWNAYNEEVESGNAHTPVLNALLDISDFVRQETISPIQGAMLVSEAFAKYGVEGVNNIPRHDDTVRKAAESLPEFKLEDAQTTLGEDIAPVETAQEPVSKRAGRNDNGLSSLNDKLKEKQRLLKLEEEDLESMYGGDHDFERYAAAVTIDRLKGEIADLERQLASGETTTEILPDDYAPMSEDEAAIVENEALSSLTDEDAPPVVDMPYYEQRDTATIDDKSLKGISERASEYLGLGRTERAVLEGIIQKYSQDENVTRDQLYSEIRDKFSVIEDSTPNEDVIQIKKDPRSMRIYVSDEVKADFGDGREDGYSKFLRSNFGRLRLVKDIETGVPVDSAYEELSDLYPSYFPEDIINPADQLRRISEMASAESNDVLPMELSDEEIQRVADMVYSDITGYMNDSRLEAATEASHIPLDDDLAPVPEEESALEQEKSILFEDYESKRADIQKLIDDKNGFISKRANELYWELSGLKKGVRASRELGYLLDQGYSWGELKTALVNTKLHPDSRVREDSAIESIVREALNEEYENLAYEIDEIDSEYNEKVQKLEADAKAENKVLSVREVYEQKLANHRNSLAALEAGKEKSLANFNEAIGKKLNEYNSLKNKNTKRANTLLQQMENLRLRRDNVQADYANRIAKQQARLEAFESKSYEEFEQKELAIRRRDNHKRIVDGIKARFTEQGYDLDEVFDKAKNLSTFATVDNTPQRVMEKSLGYKEGQILSDLTVDQVARNESEGIKWLNSVTNKKDGLLAQLVKKYGIKPGSKASAAAQMYAEGFFVDTNGDVIKYGDAELAKDFPNEQVRQNIIGLARDQRVRQFYDETLDKINESRVRNAYPEIQKLDNYFLHFRAMEDTFSRLGLPFNPNDIKAKDLPTDLNGVTADLKPGQPYFASARHREGIRTSHDLLGGLERYASSAKNQIYHIDDIQTLRAIRNYIADGYGQAKGLESLDSLTEEEAQEKIKQVYGSHLSTFAKFLNEEANVIAGKTALIDRGLEGIIGRRGITLIDTINKQVGANMVGFNVSSSLTNFIPVAQTFAKSNKFDFTKAFAQTASNKINSIFGRSDEFIDNNPTVLRRRGADRFYQTPYQKVGDIGYTLMGVVDDISTELIVRTKYNEYTRKGMSEQDAVNAADKWTSRLMADRSLGQMPQIYNSRMLGLFTKFQLEVRNQLDAQFYDTIQEKKVSNEDIENGLLRNAKTAAQVTSTFAQLAIAQHLYGMAFEAIAGYNPAFDIVSVLATALGFDDDEDDEDTVLDNLGQGFLELLEDLPYTSALKGGRIPISSALPVEDVLTAISGQDANGNEISRKDAWKTVGEAAPYYFMPGGYGQLKKTIKGMEMFDEDLPIAGSYTDSGKLRYPVDDNVKNRLQAAIFGQYANENAGKYFDGGHKALDEKQIQEFIDVDIPIEDYWDYREGLYALNKESETGTASLAEKIDYIMSLDLPIEKKNLLANNLTERKEPIDLTGYEEYGNYKDFDFAKKYPEKYAFLQDHNISVSEYEKFDEDTKEAYTWASKNPAKYKVSKAISDDLMTYRSYTDALYDIKADKDEDGKSISGSRKEKVINYINNLDADYGQKIILFKSEYPTDDTYNYEIIDYLNGRDDISYSDMVTILTELGFKVEGDNVYWD